MKRDHDHPLRVRDWLRRVERRSERAKHRDSAEPLAFLISAVVGLALAVLAAVAAERLRP